ncbi:12798_t:CDS:2 [Dentiscutata erythropus]|uniref:12798_t:CDS:1 n=1 Tax=Dentiscutata erythropus TaxID=1348616 RepID=A0A9N9BRD7_9GLOM|nr:12798_t:CDS:2 [Dentiscutata erythropus]
MRNIQYPDNKLNIKEAIEYVAASWDEVDKSTIVNCWRKTGILPMASNIEVELTQNIHLQLLEEEENEINELVYDLTDPMIIVEIMLAKNLEYEQGNPDDSDEESPHILAPEGLNGLKKFILFAEQQMGSDFDRNYLKIFRTQDYEYSSNDKYLFSKEDFLNDENLNNEGLYDENLDNKDFYNEDSYNEDLDNEDLYDENF